MNFIKKALRTKFMKTLGAILLILGKVLASLVILLLFTVWESFIGQFINKHPIESL